MSTTARVMISIIGFVSAIAFTAAIMSGAVEKGVWIAWLLVLFCLAIAFTAIPGRHAVITGRIIGGLIFAASIAYLVAEMLTPHQYAGRSSPSLVNAIFFLIFAGLPGGFVLLFGRMPKKTDEEEIVLGKVGGEEESFSEEPHIR